MLPVYSRCVTDPVRPCNLGVRIEIGMSGCRFPGLTPLIAVGFAISIAAVGAVGDGAPSALRPGVLGQGGTLLPNGWRIAPARRHTQVGTLPMALVSLAH